MKIKNPFFIKGYHGEEYFCDRVEETEKLVRALGNGSDVTLIAPRRYGKTGLIHNAFAKMDSSVKKVYLDIYSIGDFAAFARLLASEVVSALDNPFVKAGKEVLRFFRSCRPTATPSEDGIKWSFDVVPANAEVSLKELFAYLKHYRGECVIAIDEFQQVREFPETGVEALLRGYIQNLDNIHFIFAGSRRHLMQQMFLTPKAPFYLSTEILSLGPIDRSAYFEFAAGFFRKARRPCDRLAFDWLYRRFEGVTWFIQMVLNRVWESGEGLRSRTDVENAIEDIVSSRELEYHDLLFSQSESQQALLKAIAAEGKVERPQATAFIAKYRLPSTSTIGSALKDLVERDLVYRDASGYIVYDRLFGFWLSRSVT